MHDNGSPLFRFSVPLWKASVAVHVVFVCRAVYTLLAAVIVIAVVLCSCRESGLSQVFYSTVVVVRRPEYFVNITRCLVPFRGVSSYFLWWHVL